MKIARFFALCCCLWPAISFAAGDGPQPVEGYPGWTLELVKPDEDSGEYRQAYYALKPPDKRPLASITHQAAEQLQNGEVGPEAVYAGGSASGGTAEGEKKGSPSGVSGPVNNFPANSNRLSSISGASSSPSLYKAPASSSTPAADPAPTASTAASALPGAKDATGASSMPNAGGEGAPAALAVANAKSSADFQVGAVGKGTATTAAAPTVVHACTSAEDCQRVAGSSYLLGGFDGSALPSYGPGMGYMGNSLSGNAAYVCSKVGKSTVVSASTSNLPFTKASPLSFCTVGQGCQDGYVGRFEIAQGMTYKVVSAVDCK